MWPGRVGRNDDRRNTSAVTEEVERLNVSRVVVAAAFVEGHDDGGAGPEFRIGFYAVDDLLHEAFEQVQLRRRRVTIEPTIGFTNETAGSVPFWMSA